MIGIFVLGLLVLWLWFAIWASKKLNNHLWRKAGAQPAGAFAQKISVVLLTVLVILLPFIDQIIAYPKWQQLCSTTGDFEWGPGMDEKKAFGRDYYGKHETTEFTIFPNIKVSATSAKVLDAITDELLFTQPHYKYQAEALIYIPSDSGNKNAALLNTCASYGLSGKNYEKTLQLNWTNKKDATK